MSRKRKKNSYITAPHLRITGDVHGLMRKYVSQVEHCNSSLQLGDMGFDYKWLKPLSWKNHKFFGGNHDNYDVYDACPHSLGDYGLEILGGLKFYFIRGAFSIDAVGRQKAEKRGHPKSWWEEEQLNLNSLSDAIKDYESIRPETMITHTCPVEIARLIGNPRSLRSLGYVAETFNTPTQAALQVCFETHKPNLWIFGHFHMNKAFEYKGTLFVCLEELQNLDADKSGKFSHNGYTGVLGQ